MNGWVRKRFWKTVEVSRLSEGHAVMLDGRMLKTPGKQDLVLPTHAVAELVAAEWRAQSDVIDPEVMPATRAANSAIDKVRGQKAEVTGLLAAYGDSDLVCYRAEGPEALLMREARAWDPILDWAAHRFGIRPLCHTGVMHAPQPEALLVGLHADVDRLDAFELTALHDLVAMSGSLLLALAVIDRFDTPETLWRLSRVDEDWQAEQWGTDEEAENLAEARKQSFLAAARFYFALQ